MRVYRDEHDERYETMKRLALAGLTAIVLCALATRLSLAQEEFTYAPLDDFEDTGPWIKGDPNTDLTQKDAAVAPNHEFVKQGKQSLAFMIHVNWTPREGEKYPKGWPMMTRDFDPPQDWSGYDRVVFWLYTETEAQIPTGRALRCGPRRAEAEEGIDWYTLPGIEPGKWQLMSVPLAADLDWGQVTGFSFYVAEAWWQDGDRINFYIDDMRLARRNWPVIQDCSVSARTAPRGTRLRVEVKIEGQPEDSSVRCTVSGADRKTEAQFRWRLTDRHHSFDLDLAAVPAGGHHAKVELLDAGGKPRDSRSQYFRSMEAGKRTYLSLITFYSPHLTDATSETLSVLNDSAYAGVAIPFWGGYDTAPVPDYEELEPQLKLAREALKIDLWPWVFANRFIGSPEDARGHAGRNAPNPEYFERIPILDLDNETGARADMMKMWRIAIRAAKQWGSPGIVLDEEAYNNYPAYNVEYLAQRRNESLAEVIEKCEAVGADLAKIVEEEYPECIIWTLFSRLDRPKQVRGYDGQVHPAPGHINLGFLKYAKAHQLPCKLLCGGEVSVGYYNPTPEALREKIAQRDRNMAWALEEFPDHLFLAGTISPYHDYKILTSWIKDRAGDDPQLKTIADFQPMFKTLFDAYDWVWVYASSAGRTVPYNPDNNRGKWGQSPICRRWWLSEHDVHTGNR